MPLSGDYTWSETAETVTISVPLKGASRKAVDISTTANIIKISYKPFLLDLNLFQDIAEDKSKAIFKDGMLVISLTKRECQLWGQLYFIGSKSEIAIRREKSLHQTRTLAQQQKDAAAASKVNEERLMLREHMALEEKERQRMDDIKGRQKKDAEDEMYEAFSKPKPIRESNECLPKPIRESVHATFTHTPRLFKTPLRKSTKKQEEEFIIKNRSKLRNNDNALLNNKDVGDVDPHWLKSKGDEFYQRGDFLSAIKAYNEALNTDPDHIQVRMNRAACHLALQEFETCISDCNTSLTLLSEALHPTPLIRRKWQVIMLCRRSTAKQLKNDLLGALCDLEEAMQITKVDDDVAAKAIAKDIDDLKVKINSTKAQDIATS